MPEILFENSLLCVEKLAADRTLVLRRSAERSGQADLLRAYEDALKLADPYRGWSLLMDMREALGRNDPDFEQSVGKFRHESARLFPRVVVLVASPVGVLQVNRLNQGVENRSLVTTSEAEALTWCRQAQGL